MDQSFSVVETASHNPPAENIEIFQQDSNYPPLTPAGIQLKEEQWNLIDTAEANVKNRVSKHLFLKKHGIPTVNTIDGIDYVGTKRGGVGSLPKDKKGDQAGLKTTWEKSMKKVEKGQQTILDMPRTATSSSISTTSH